MDNFTVTTYESGIQKTIQNKHMYTTEIGILHTQLETSSLQAVKQVI
jgi:hypothetical protein